MFQFDDVYKNFTRINSSCTNNPDPNTNTLVTNCNLYYFLADFNNNYTSNYNR